MSSKSPQPAVYNGGRGIEPVGNRRARRLLTDIGLYCLIIATTFVFAEFVRDPMPASELRYFWFYYIFTLPALAWGVVAVPALVALDLFSARRFPSAHRKTLIVASAVLVGLPAAYVFRDLPLILIFATGGGIYGWAYRSVAPASETK